MKTILYGNGAMARVLYSYARRKRDIVGFTVDDHCIADDSLDFLGLPLAPFSCVQARFPPTSHNVLIAVGFAEMNELRARKSDETRRKSYSLTSYIDDSVVIHDDVSIGENCTILDHVSIHPGCRIGEGTFISSNVNLGHDCSIGPFTWINAGVAIAGGCRVGMGCFFGVNSSAAQGLCIGARNFIAANTFIGKHTGDDQVYLSEQGQLFRLKSKSFLGFCGMTV